LITSFLKRVVPPVLVLIACGGDSSKRLDGIREDEVQTLGLTQGVAGRAGMLHGCATVGCTHACGGPTDFAQLDADVAVYASDQFDPEAPAVPCTQTDGQGELGARMPEPQFRATPDEDGLFGLALPEGKFVLGLIDRNGCVLRRSTWDVEVTSDSVIVRDLLL
jgi:hypothetical protein